MPRVVRVRCAVSSLDKTFDYLADDDGNVPVAVGTSVRVQLGGRRVNGWITDVDVEPLAGVTLRPLRALRGYGPTEELVGLATWAAWRWAGSETRFLSAAASNRNVTTLGSAPVLTYDTVAQSQRDSDDDTLVALGRGADSSGPLLIGTGAQTDPFAVVIGTLLAASALGPLGGDAGSVIIAAPSVGYAARLVERLRVRGIDAVHFADSWSCARAGWPVIVGTRAVAWAPVPTLRAVVILDAHDAAYREERAPTWSAVDVLVERARRSAVPLVAPTPLGTPTLRSFAARQVTLGHKAQRDWPAVVVDDVTTHDPREGLFSSSFVDVARRALSAPEHRDGPRLVVLLNRVGRARLLSCRACGALATCGTCGRSVGEESGHLHCASCGHERPVVCLSCGGGAFRTIRSGVAKVAPELSALLRVEVADITATSDASALVAPVLVGTEAVLHRVRHANSVAIFELDQHLFAPRLSAVEETLALVVRAARLIGRRRDHTGGVLHLATRLPRHPVVEGVVRGDLDAVFNDEAALREAAGLPPYSALAELVGDGARDALVALEERGGVDVSELGDRRLLVQAPDHAVLSEALSHVRERGIDVRIEVDPTSL